MQRELTPFQNGILLSFNSYRNEVANYGFAISQFSKLEFSLLALFNKIDDRPTIESTAAYWQINSCYGRFCWINKRLKKRQGDDPLRAMWLAISDSLEDAIDLRNDLAHGEFTPILISENKPLVGFWPRLAETATTGQMSVNHAEEKIDGIKFFTSEDLLTHALHFIDLSEAIYAIVDRAKND